MTISRTLTAALYDAGRSQRGAETGLRFLDRHEREELVTWNEIWKRARALQQALAGEGGATGQAGVVPGQRIAIIYPTVPGFFDAFLGVLMAGAIPVPLYPPVRLGRLDEYHRRTARMLDLVDATGVLADTGVARLLGETLAASAARPWLLTPRDLRPVSTARDTESGAPRWPPPIHADGGGLAMVQFSSGTTREPKPVALSHRAVLAQARMLASHFPDGGRGGDAGRTQSGVSWLPLYHDMGLIGCVFTALVRAADLTLLPPEAFLARPALWLRAISKARATVSPAPNFAYSLCVDRIRDEELEGVDLSSWQVALNGAEAVTPGVLRRFSERFGAWGFRAEALTPVYGLAEASLAVTFSPPEERFLIERFDQQQLETRGLAEPLAAGSEESAVELVSVGRPVPGFDLEIRSEEGRQLPEGEVGEIYTRGPSLMAGYLGMPEETEQALEDGWLRTGDEGFVFGGDLYVTGRTQDLVIVRGRNHSPELIEEAASRVPGVRTGCVVAAGHRFEAQATESLVVFAERARGERPVDALIESGVRGEVLSAVGLEPGEVILLEPGVLPRTSSGKLRRREALKQHLQGQLEARPGLSPVRLALALWRSARARRILSRSLPRERS